MPENPEKLDLKKSDTKKEPPKEMSQEQLAAYVANALGTMANAMTSMALSIETISMDMQDFRRCFQQRMLKVDNMAPDDIPGFGEDDAPDKEAPDDN